MKTFKEIEEYAAKNFVPIARKDFVEFFKDLIIKNNFHDILEIGSAIGYTTVNLALLENVYVTTIEYNDARYELCMVNIKDFNVEDKVLAIHDDALNVFISQKFDVIFIDNIVFNDFKKYVSPKKAKFYEGKINELKEYLASLTNYDVCYSEIGDGIAILKKK